MKVIVAGGTGFLGKALVSELIENRHQVVLLRRPSSKSKVPEMPEIQAVEVDIENPIVSTDFTGDVIINLIGIIREFPSKGITFHKSHYLVTKHLVDFARASGIKRFLQMSALGVKPDAQIGYEQTKFAAECYLRESGLDWTIFRPSIVVGPNAGLIGLLSKMISRLPVVPVIGNGCYRVQPVYIKDVIAGFVKSLGNDRAIGRVFEFGGPEIMTFDQMIDTLGDAIGKSRLRIFHQPIWMLRLMAALFGRFSWFPVTKDQIIMLLEESYTEDKSYFEFFGITPKSFSQALEEFIRPNSNWGQ
jgi:uncharacterized protein YbjT (DUF2867 family)